ncbi:Gfo/Idh/MocA family protein [Kiritimatiella glycovorans]|uniref:Putative oxidoreductase n=1 Tax=Kiritimatiella glycovorans TaxID=1307763 RepID=A0A0G3EDM9_9BACT|nr:Gfo/Idh/MocA family oxidoreductase [Kiritimatiella glycovorans]AKJ63502.1 putative oxidoreductase [Kiritimatiella glycovorans]
MDKKTVRSGIAGLGFSGSFHYENIRRVYGTGVDFRGVYDRDAEKCAAWAGERGVHAYDSLEAMLDDVDVVHVCTVASSHEAVALAALARGVSPIVEKPLTGYFGDGSGNFNGETASKETALREAMASVQRMREAEQASEGRILYAENWVYAPSIQKEREVIEKTGAQCLWIYGEEAHSGSHADTYGFWKHSGGGVTISKGCHPLTAALYLKRKEGLARDGRPIRPAAVTSRTHAITRLPGYRDEGHLRTGYHDIDDFSMVHIVFDDGTVADIFSSDIIMGGIHNWLEVAANNHRTMCNINPNTAMETYNPVESNFNDIYVVEKTGTKQGWSNPSPDEDWFTGYPQEIEAFYRAAAAGEAPESGIELGADAIATIYTAYVSDERGGAEVAVERSS